MPAITANVEFDTVAREWRMKWSEDSDKASLSKVQEILDTFIAELKAVPGVKSVQRVVCGGCLDYKIITALDASIFGDWEGKEFHPEKAFLAAVKVVPGISAVETQTYTLMSM